jgi:hypothetical protein
MKLYSFTWQSIFSMNHTSNFIGRILGYRNHIIRETPEVQPSFSLMNMKAFYQNILEHRKVCQNDRNPSPQ